MVAPAQPSRASQASTGSSCGEASDVPDVCDLPVGGSFCDVAGGAISDLAGSAFDAAAQRIAEGYAKATELVLTFWTNIDTPALNSASGPVKDINDSLNWAVVFVGT